ncbi:hypothetical protein [Ruminiclostridium papyrosolvens]|uniref:Fibronectin type-III domain-containing protein n=1 Tax=Ruminiclostridium papyrosolvens C7 TaxID=1330534 RepID=U4R0S3_9FIRM|nr:hypothetical protein [Ruminiclostridium papyrosolvens]EPR11516.1 hypothetical protein L323_11685 [Ruminiclostridium papyrosolvens C7]
MEISVPILSFSTINVTDTSVEFVWTTKNNCITGVSYEIYRNERIIKSVDSFTYTDLDLMPNITYQYRIKKPAAEERLKNEDVKNLTHKEYSDLNEETQVLDSSSNGDNLYSLKIKGPIIKVSGGKNHTLAVISGGKSGHREVILMDS